MKKTMVVALIALAMLSFGGLAVAAPQGPGSAQDNWYCPYYGQNINNLTDDQKAQLAAWQQQAFDQRKEILQKQVEWGWITQAQADQQISWMEQRLADGTYGHGHGPKGMGGFGMMGPGGGQGCW